MTILTRPLGMTQTRQLLTFPSNGYAPNVTAYLWGGGGGAGGSDGIRQGGTGSGGGYVQADFTVNPGDTIEIVVGAGGSCGVNSDLGSAVLTPIFNTRTAIPIGATSALPKASATNVARWSAFLNQTGVWNTGTSITGANTNLSQTLTFDQSYTVFFEIKINYVFILAAYYQATVYLDGEVLIESGLDSWKNQNTAGIQFVRTITPGLRTVRIVATANPGATYGTFGVGLTIATAGNAGLGGGGLVRNVFDTLTTTATPPLFVPNGIATSDKIYSNLLFDFGVWEQNQRAISCSRTYNNIYFPYTGVYQIQMSVAESCTLSIDGSQVFSISSGTAVGTALTQDVTVTQGYHTVAFSASFSGIIPNAQMPSAGVAITISKSWSGATGGLAGPVGSSGGGGGSGGCTTLVLNPGTTNETLLAVAVGGAGGGGAGASTTGQGESTAPGPRGQTVSGISNGQVGENQGRLYADGGGGGAGGPGGPGGAGLNGYSSVGDSYGQAGSLGISYRNTSATTGGQVIEPSGRLSGGRNSQYYSLIGGAVGNGAGPGQFRAEDGAAVFVLDAYGIQVRNDAIDGNWHDVKTAFVWVDGTWRQTFATYIYQNNAWQMVIGGAPLTFVSQNDQSGRLSRPPDNRPAPPPPPPPVYDSVRLGCCCFVAGTLINMADGSTKAIEDVDLGEVVVGRDGAHNTVLEFLRPTLGETGATLMAFNGGKPFMASDHPVYVRGQGWKSFDPEMTYSKYSMTVGQYQVGDVIETLDGVEFAIHSIEEYNDQDPDQTIYNFILDGNNTYIANNLVVHNKGAGGCGAGGSGGGSGGGGCCCCFVAGTLITMADGSYKRIEDVALGEVVVGRDNEYNTVLELRTPTLGETRAALVAFNGGKPFMASDHPVWIRNQGWKSHDPEMTYNKYGLVAGKFTVGDVVETDDQIGLEIVSIEEYNDQDLNQTIYNLHVTGNHTYTANGLIVWDE